MYFYKSEIFCLGLKTQKNIENNDILHTYGILQSSKDKVMRALPRGMHDGVLNLFSYFFFWGGGHGIMDRLIRIGFLI